MSAMNSNAAARLPFLKALNTPQTTTAASHSAAGAKVAARSPGDGPSEFSRMLVRSQTAAAVSQRTTAPADKAAPPKRPESPPPSPRAETASSSKPADPGAANGDAVDDTEAGSTASASAAQPSEPKAVARARADAAREPEAVDATVADPAAAGSADPTDPAAAAVAAAPTAAELASLAAWGALPMPPAAPLDAMPTVEGEAAGAGDAAAPATGPMGLVEAPIDSATAAPSAAEPLMSTDASDVPPAPDRESLNRGPADKAALAVDVALAKATAHGVAPDATLAHLAMLASGARPDSQGELRGTDLATPPAWAIGAPGASTLARSVDAAAAPAAASVATPLTDSGFHEALGMQVSLLAREGIQKAELRLNPADMGPVSVQITMNGDQARVDFGADLAQTRQVIEAGWAELAASLREAGFTLSGGGVSQHARNRQEPAAAPKPGAELSDSTEDVAVASVVARPRAGAALDLYA